MSTLVHSVFASQLVLVSSMHNILRGEVRDACLLHGDARVQDSARPNSILAYGCLPGARGRRVLPQELRLVRVAADPQAVPPSALNPRSSLPLAERWGSVSTVASMFSPAR